MTLEISPLDYARMILRGEPLPEASPTVLEQDVDPETKELEQS